MPPRRLLPSPCSYLCCLGPVILSWENGPKYSILTHTITKSYPRYLTSKWNLVSFRIRNHLFNSDESFPEMVIPISIRKPMVRVEFLSWWRARILIRSRPTNIWCWVSWDSFVSLVFLAQGRNIPSTCHAISGNQTFGKKILPRLIDTTLFRRTV